MASIDLKKKVKSSHNLYFLLMHCLLFGRIFESELDFDVHYFDDILELKKKTFVECTRIVKEKR